MQEVEKLIDNNLQLITDYTKRAAELIGSVRQLEKERDKLTKKNRGLEVVRCKDCVKLNRHDCPMAYIERKQNIAVCSGRTKFLLRQRRVEGGLTKKNENTKVYGTFR